MNFAIIAKFLPQTATKPSRFKFTNGKNTIKAEVCINGDQWNAAEEQNQHQFNTVKNLAEEFARIKLNWNYSEFEIGMIKEYPPIYSIVPVGENRKKPTLNLF